MHLHIIVTITYMHVNFYWCWKYTYATGICETWFNQLVPELAFDVQNLRMRPVAQKNSLVHL